MSKVVSIRLKDEQYERLRKLARRLDRTPSETVARVLEEGMREREFPYIVFKDTVVGREAFLSGTRLKVWMIAWIGEKYEYDLARMEEHFGVPAFKLQAALDYAKAYPEDIAEAIAGNDRGEEELRRLLPNLEVIVVRDP